MIQLNQINYINHNNGEKMDHISFQIPSLHNGMCWMKQSLESSLTIFNKIGTLVQNQLTSLKETLTEDLSLEGLVVSPLDEEDTQVEGCFDPLFALGTKACRLIQSQLQTKPPIQKKPFGHTTDSIFHAHHQLLKIEKKTPPFFKDFRGGTGTNPSPSNYLPSSYRGNRSPSPWKQSGKAH